MYLRTFTLLEYVQDNQQDVQLFFSHDMEAKNYKAEMSI